MQGMKRAVVSYSSQQWGEITQHKDCHRSLRRANLSQLDRRGAGVWQLGRLRSLFKETNA